VGGLNQVNGLGYLDGENWDDMIEFLTFEYCSAFCDAGKAESDELFVRQEAKLK